ADRVMSAIDRDVRPAPVRQLRSSRAPIVTAAVVAFAAAAGLFLWVRDPNTQAQFEKQKATGEMVMTSPAGAFIEVVDFGARPGAIFYVPSEGESDTAVIWLTE